MTYPEEFSSHDASFSVDPQLKRWVATWVRDDGLEVSRLLPVKVRDGALSDSESNAVIEAYEAMRYGTA
jgi:hypothetical protein